MGLASSFPFANPAFVRAQAVTEACDNPAALTREQVEELIRPHFVCNDDELWQLAVDTYQHCIFGRVRPAEPPLAHDWLIPGGVYVGQWIWDTMFVVDLLSVLDNQR